MYMYYACPFYSKTYNNKKNASTTMPQDVFTGYYSQIGLARFDRVPYNTSLEGAEDSTSSIMPWEYVMLADDSRQANFNSGTVVFDKTDKYARDIRVTMFAQRSDGSVKPAGEITGGYVESKYAIGDVYLKR